MDAQEFERIKQQVRDYYGKDGNICGGSLHIVLDDGNIGIDSIKFCITNAWDQKDADGARLGFALLKLSPRKRYELYRMEKP